MTASKAAVGPMTVKATTSDGTATAGTDCTALASKVLRIPAGETSADAEVVVSGDTEVESTRR